MNGIMRKSCRNKNFTLIELVVALAVFAILASLIMQFFSGAQRLWLDSEARANAYAEARASMEVINELLASLVFCEGSSSAYDGFFQLDNTAGNSKVFFMSKTKMPLPQASDEPKNDIRFIGILRGDDSGSDINRNPLHRLYITVFCDCNTCNPDKSRDNFLYAALFTPYGIVTDVSNRGDAKTKLTDTASSGKLCPASAVHKSVLAERVLDFSVTAMQSDGTRAAANTDIAVPPAMLQVSITQMDTADNLEKWGAMSDGTPKDEFKQEHSRVFTRAFYLGNR